jgi:hypothetical protein
VVSENKPASDGGVSLHKAEELIDSQFSLGKDGAKSTELHVTTMNRHCDSKTCLGWMPQGVMRPTCMVNVKPSALQSSKYFE